MLDDANRDHLSLSEQEQQLLELVRAGKVDAEIAVRLGISNAEVKARLERLAWKQRAANRQELRAEMLEPGPAAQGWPLPTAPPRRVPYAVVAALVVLAAAGGAAAGWLFRGGNAALPAPQATYSASAVPPTALLPTQTPVVTEIAGRQMRFLGRPFVVGSVVPTMNVEARETLLVVELGQPAVLRYDEFRSADGFFGGGPLSLVTTVRYDERTILLDFTIQNGGQVVRGDDNSVTFVGSNAGGPTVLISAHSQACSCYLHVELDSTGRLFLSNAVPANQPVAFDTGESLDLSNALPLGSTVPADHWILCGHGNGAPCTSLLRGDFVPLGPGLVMCDEGDGALTFISEGESGATLRFKSERRPSSLVCREPVRHIDAGEALGYGGLYEVMATARDGSPASVLITRHGVIYLSRNVAKFGCPCRTGN